MKVNPTQSQSVQDNVQLSKTQQNDKAKDSKSSGKNSGSSGTAAPGDTRTEISSRAKDMARAKQIASGAPDVNDAKIAELKKKIAEGSYKPSAEDIAERMVNEHLQSSGLG